MPESRRTAKTGTEVSLPILPPLARSLAATPGGDLSFLATAKGRNFTKESFGNWFRGACRAAGVSKSCHGLRKLAATTAAERGATEAQLNAVFGWTEGSRESAVYIRRANRKRTKKPKENKGMHGQLERLVGDAGLAFPSDFSDLSENRGKRTPLESFRNLSVDPAPERPRTGPPWPPDPRKGSRRPVGGPDGDGIKETALATAVLPQRRWHVNRCLLVEAVRP